MLRFGVGTMGLLVVLAALTCGCASRNLYNIGANDIPFQLAHLRSNDATERSYGCTMLFFLSPEAKASPLVAEATEALAHTALYDPEPKVRSDADNALWEIGAPSVPAVLKAHREAAKPEVRKHAAVSLAMFGAHAVPLVMAELRSPASDEHRKLDLANVLRVIGKSAKPALTEALSDPDLRVRALAKLALERIDER